MPLLMSSPGKTNQLIKNAVGLVEIEIGIAIGIPTQIILTI